MKEMLDLTEEKYSWRTMDMKDEVKPLGKVSEQIEHLMGRNHNIVIAIQSQTHLGHMLSYDLSENLSSGIDEIYYKLDEENLGELSDMSEKTIYIPETECYFPSYIRELKTKRIIFERILDGRKGNVIILNVKDTNNLSKNIRLSLDSLIRLHNDRTDWQKLYSVYDSFTRTKNNDVHSLRSSYYPRSVNTYEFYHNKFKEEREEILHDLINDVSNSLKDSETRQKNFGKQGKGKSHTSMMINEYSEKFGIEDEEEKDMEERRIDDWKEEIHEIAKEKGWWEDERTFGEIVSLIHSEVSEALEEHREDDKMFYYEGEKPEGKGVELVDAIIRILDYLGRKDVDVEEILKAKCEYNKGREYRHGDKNL